LTFGFIDDPVVLRLRQFSVNRKPASVGLLARGLPGVSAPADASLAGGAHRLRGRQHASLGILHPADQAQAPGRCAIRDAH